MVRYHGAHDILGDGVYSDIDDVGHKGSKSKTDVQPEPGCPSLSIATRTPRGRWCSIVRARHSQQRCLSDINDAARKGSKPKADAQVKLGIPEQSTDNGILIKSATLSSAPRPHRVHTKAKNPRQRVRRQTLTKVTWRQPLTKGKARQVSSLYTSTKPKNL